MSVLLRYTGPQATSFQTGLVGTVEPGGEFTVPPELAPRFLARPDIERVTPGEPGAEDVAAAADEPGTEADPAAAAAPSAEAVTLQRAG